MSRPVVQPAAVADMAAIADYIAERSPTAALKVLLELQAAIDRLAEYPAMGRLRPQLAGDRIRFFRVGAYQLIYLADAAPIEIIRILHIRRDVRKLTD